MYYLLFPALAQRQAFIARLKEQEILSVFHYLPLHLSDMGLRYGGKAGDFPVTERVSDQLVRLPFFYNLTDAEQDRVIETVISQPV
jgi:dTDP-4-amino-4,6-dideoxygalactose transaminase